MQNRIAADIDYHTLKNSNNNSTNSEAKVNINLYEDLRIILRNPHRGLLEHFTTSCNTDNRLEKSRGGREVEVFAFKSLQNRDHLFHTCINRCIKFLSFQAVGPGVEIK